MEIPEKFDCHLNFALHECEKPMMAPESERAMKPSQVLTPDEARSIGLTVPTDAVAIHIYGGRFPIPPAPQPAPASCSEVVDMLAKCIIGDYTPNALGGAYKGVFRAQFDREQAEMILSDWRKQITVRGGE